LTARAVWACNIVLRGAERRDASTMFLQTHHATCLAAACAAIGVLATTAYADPPFSAAPWATAYAVKRTEPIRIDGDLSEWTHVPGVKMAEEKFFFAGQGMSAAHWKGAADLSAVFKLRWDRDYLYVAIEVTDDDVTEPHGSLTTGTETGSWDDDGIELMLDSDGCGMPRYYVGDERHHEMHFVYSAKHPYVFDNFWKPEPGAPAPMFKRPDGSEEPLGYGNEVMVKNDVTARFTAPPYKGNFAFRRTASGYNLELRVALVGAEMTAINEGGHRIGFDLAINDNDAGSGPLKQQLHWSGVNGMFWRNCQYFGTLLLLNR
jgi:Carbohydrate family 9 binding domain-like